MCVLFYAIIAGWAIFWALSWSQYDRTAHDKEKLYLNLASLAVRTAIMRLLMPFALALHW